MPDFIPAGGGGYIVPPQFLMSPATEVARPPEVADFTLDGAQTAGLIRLFEYEIEGKLRYTGELQQTTLADEHAARKLCELENQWGRVAALRYVVAVLENMRAAATGQQRPHQYVWC